MTLREFVDAAFALMVRTYAAIPGKTILDAIELAKETFGMTTEEEKARSVEDQNQSSLAALEKMMAGV